MDADVIIVGAGPTGLMLAGELRLAGVRALVLERAAAPRVVPRAGGLGGQILRLLKYRGLLDRVAAASTDASPAPRFPFGGVHVDLTRLVDPPMHALQIPQPRLEKVLDERALEVGAEIRRGHEVIGVSQDDDIVTAEVRGPEGTYRVSGRYLVGCDGPRSRIRELSGISFPGITYPEVNRLGQVAMHETVTLLDSGEIEVPGLGRLRSDYIRTERGVFGFGVLGQDALLVSTTEDESREYDDDVPMTMAELRDSVRRVLGVDFPLGEATRLSRFTFQARQAERYRDGRIFLAGDAAHLFPATGVALNAGMLDAVNLAWKLAADIGGRADLLDTYQEERHFAGARTLLHTQAQVALRRGQDAAADALRAIFQELLTDEQALRRMGARIAGTDLRYPMTGDHALIGTFAPDLTLSTDQGTTSVADLMRGARPVLLDLAGGMDLHEVAGGWLDRVDAVTAKTDNRPADALLIRPDAHIVWAAGLDEPVDTAALRKALSEWFGIPN
jgi:2-polyprenyl-6-methoxyphenol hydroxylase-like FAD-dependent oxidoreductase